MDLPDAFHSPYQITPLDLHTDAFYQRRQSFIDERLSQIQNSTTQVYSVFKSQTFMETTLNNTLLFLVFRKM